MKRLYLTSLSALALSACAAGPDFKAPIGPPKATGAFIGSANPAVSTAAANDTWWHLYNDPVLDQLVADALAANTDIRVAVARLDKARASLRETRSDRLPQANIGSNGGYGRTAESQRLPGTPAEGASYDVGLNVSYEVDLAGRVRRSIEAARGDVRAADADADAVRVSVVAATTRAYVDATSSAERLEVAKRIVELLDKSAILTGKRVDAGRAEKLDLVRITTLRDQRAALVPQIEAERQAALFRLATLTGRAPQDLPPIAAERTTTPRLDQPIPVGDGAGLLARRPDVRAAEQRLAAATARIGVATADLYPHISLGGSVGASSASLSDLFTGGALRWLVGPLISWSLNQDAVRARIAGSQADSRAALAQFDGTVLGALEEIETALSTYQQELRRHAALVSARDGAAAAARITRARQREGQIDFLEVLDAERTFADTDADLAASNARIAGAQVDLFRSLGGGWGKDVKVASR
ncbi:MAG: TolC family protein [Sphingomonas bacterium]